MGRPDHTARWTIDGLLEAKAATAALLDRLGLEGYLFEVEPRSDEPELRVRVEWVSGGPDGTWTTTDLRVDAEALLRSRAERAPRDRILRAWRQRFRARERAASRARDAHA